MRTFFHPVCLALSFPVENPAHDGLQCTTGSAVGNRRLVKVDGGQGGVIMVHVHRERRRVRRGAFSSRGWRSRPRTPHRLAAGARNRPCGVPRHGERSKIVSQRKLANGSHKHYKKYLQHMGTEVKGQKRVSRSENKYGVSDWAAQRRIRIKARGSIQSNREANEKGCQTPISPESSTNETQNIQSVYRGS